MPTHEYATYGVYIIRVTSDLTGEPRLGLSKAPRHITSLGSWGDLGFTSLSEV